MSYLTRIDELRRAELFKRARQFAETYDPGLPSILVLPGGMGSRLQRSTHAYDPTRTPGPETFYELWCGLAPIFGGELKYLAQNVFTEDADKHPIIAAGELTNVVKSYDGIFEHFEGQANVIGLGYDWRRAPAKEAGYVRVFLQLVAEQVKKVNPLWPDPRKRLTVYAHSQGGLVAKFFANDLADASEDPADWFERLVTCCTPFYGTSSHFERYYVGEPLLNLFTGGADAVAKIVASFEGTYILLPAPREVLRPRLAKFGLVRYPVRDYDDERIECDPFDASPAIKGRYRPEMSRAHLVLAHDQFVLLDRPLPSKFSERIFHIRSDSSGSPPGRDLEIRWKAVDGATYGAYRGNPIRFDTYLPGNGDGTVPLWSARLAATPDENVFDIKGVGHGGAAEHRCSLTILGNLMLGQAAPRLQVAQPDSDPSSASHIALLASQLHGLPPEEAGARVAALPPGEYRAFVDRLRLSA